LPTIPRRTINTDGKCTVVDGVSKPGDYVEMRTEMDVLCLISKCPQIHNPCNGFFPTPVRVIVFEVQTQTCTGRKLILFDAGERAFLERISPGATGARSCAK
jgi:uncharacterized protein YcgI (DUF1989 family)